MNPLPQLHAEIDARVSAIRSHTPDWLCGKGCAKCCRSLAQVPQLTAAEWRLLQEGLAALTPEQLAEIRRRIAALATQPSRPVVCPLLDQATNACPVYAQRPVACRTYGFYVQRELGLYCSEIEAQVADGTLAEVVWGNHDVIDQSLTRQGESRALTEWFALVDTDSTGK
jgi:Fe-S-cluster containining protein